MSTIGFAAIPEIEVEPMWSIRSANPWSAIRKRSPTEWKTLGHSGSYGTTETYSDTSGNSFCDRIDIHLQRIGYGSTLDDSNILPPESGVGRVENGANLPFRYCCDITSISKHLRRENE